MQSATDDNTEYFRRYNKNDNKNDVTADAHLLSLQEYIPESEDR